jgi:hypothetical protein
MNDFAMTAPCSDCPWRRDAPTGKFPRSRFIHLARTCVEGAPPGKVFGCHKTEWPNQRACAGMLAVCGLDINTLRLALSRGWWHPNAIDTKGLELFSNYREMAEANGVSPRHRALRHWPGRGV